MLFVKGGINSVGMATEMILLITIIPMFRYGDVKGSCSIVVVVFGRIVASSVAVESSYNRISKEAPTNFRISAHAEQRPPVWTRPFQVTDYDLLFTIGRKRGHQAELF